MAMLKSKKGITGAVFAVVGGAIALMVGIWVISLVINSISLPTTLFGVVNETDSYTTNGTYLAYAAIPTCFSGVNHASVCGVQPGNLLTVENTSLVYGSGNYTYNTTGLILQSSVGFKSGSLILTYNYYDFSSASANSGLTTVQTTVFNAFTLLAVGLIVLAAAVIIGYFSFGRKT